MATNLFVISLVLQVLCITATLGSAQFWRRTNGYTFSYPQWYHQQQLPYLKNNQQRPNQELADFQIPSGISVSTAEWVCKSPKTGDMMIITAQDDPLRNTAEYGQWQQPSHSQPQPPIKNQPINHQIDSKYPQDTPNLYEKQMTTKQPAYTQNNQNQQPTLKQEEPNKDPSNTNGEGLIDIRFGNM